MPRRVRLTWTDSNSSESGFKVYRSLSTIDPEDLPEPLAILPPNSILYLDEDILDETEYFYRVSAFSDFAEKVSLEVSVVTSQPLPDIGAFWAEQGGYFAGTSSLGFHVIVAPKSTEVSRAYKTTNTPTAGTSSNTLNANELRAAIAAAGLANHPAMSYAAAYGGGGFSDWTLPGATEAVVINNNLNPNTTLAPLFQVGGAQQFRNASTHASAADWWYVTARSGADTTYIGFRPAAPAAFNFNKTEARPTRPIRIIPA